MKGKPGDSRCTAECATHPRSVVDFNAVRQGAVRAQEPSESPAGPALAVR
ncbi:hypothetical protein [Streptomyces sp. IMTB 2501]